MIFMQNLKKARELYGKTQKEIAEILSTSIQQYQRWEQGKWQMPIENYKSLAEYYGYSVDYLCGLSSTPIELTDDIKKNIEILHIYREEFAKEIDQELILLELEEENQNTPPDTE